MFPYRRVCTVQSVVCLVWGAVIAVRPTVLFWLLQAETDAFGTILGHFAGGVLFALGACLWALRELPSGVLRRRVAQANAIVDAWLFFVFVQAFNLGLTGGFVGGMILFFFGFNTLGWLGTTRDRSEA